MITDWGTVQTSKFKSSKVQKFKVQSFKFRRQLSLQNNGRQGKKNLKKYAFQAFL